MTTKTRRFYTDKEVELIKNFISNNKPAKTNIQAIAKKLKRSEASISAKYVAIKKGMEPRTATSRKLSQTTNMVDIPKGLRLEFRPTKIILEDGKITLFY